MHSESGACDGMWISVAISRYVGSGGRGGLVWGDLGWCGLHGWWVLLWGDGVMLSGGGVWVMWMGGMVWCDVGIWVMLVRTLGVYGHGWDSRQIWSCVLNLSY